MRTLVFHPDVQNEIRSGYEWYNEKLEGLGDEFLEELDKAFRNIRLKPKVSSYFSPKFRRFLLSRFPYGILYKENDSSIYVAAVMHLSRKPGYWKKRKLK